MCDDHQFSAALFVFFFGGAMVGSTGEIKKVCFFMGLLPTKVVKPLIFVYRPVRLIIVSLWRVRGGKKRTTLPATNERMDGCLGLIECRK